MYERFQRPTQALVIKWLRVKHDIHILPNVTLDSKYGHWYYCTVMRDVIYKRIDGSYHPEQAIEAAILYCLKNLL